MINTPVFFEKDKLKWEAVDAKIQRQVVGYDDKIMMVNVKFDKDGIGAMHYHPHTQVTYIAEGKFEVTVGDETKIVKKGDSFFIPSNVMHGVICLEEGTLIDVFSPMRDDFLK